MNCPGSSRQPLGGRRSNRFIVNVPCSSVNPSPTGVRRKMIFEDDPASYEEGEFQTRDENGFEDETFDPFNCDANFNVETNVECPPKSFQNKGNLEKLRNLIDEENKRINSSTELVRSIENAFRRPKTFREATSAIRRDANTNFDVDSDVESRLPAAMLEAQKQGIPLEQSRPSRVYGRLFPEDKGRPIVQVRGICGKQGDRVMPKMTGIWRGKELEYDLDAGIIDFYGLKTAKKPQEPPKPAPHKPGENVNEIFGITNSEDMDEKEDKFKFKVNREERPRGNFVQLRGSGWPLWFPGYMHVMPGQALVQYTEEPYGILDRAWRSMSPSDVDTPHGNFVIGS